MTLKREDQNGLKARMVLKDTTDAYHDLLQAKQEGDRRLFRRRWVAAITLLRAVGHVLNGADKKLHPALAQPISQFFETTKGDPLFNDFIKNTRDLTVKEYRSGLFGVWGTDSPMAIEPVSETDVIGGELVFRGGKLDGKKLEVIFPRALSWWDKHLKILEAELERR
jgi:hypothetical protein